MLDRMASFFRPSASTDRDFSLLLGQKRNGAAARGAPVARGPGHLTEENVRKCSPEGRRRSENRPGCRDL